MTHIRSSAEKQRFSVPFVPRAFGFFAGHLCHVCQALFGLPFCHVCLCGVWCACQAVRLLHSDWIWRVGGHEVAAAILADHAVDPLDLQLACVRNYDALELVVLLIGSTKGRAFICMDEHPIARHGVESPDYVNDMSVM